MDLTDNDFQIRNLAGIDHSVADFMVFMNKNPIEMKKQILDNQEKSKKYDILMTHTKYHNSFGCQYHFKIKEGDRKNQFLQSENVELEAKLEKQTDNVFDLLETGLNYKTKYDKLLIKINNRIVQLENDIENKECDVFEGGINSGELLKDELEDLIK